MSSLLEAIIWLVVVIVVCFLLCVFMDSNDEIENRSEK